MSLVTTGPLWRWPGFTNAVSASYAIVTEDTLDATGEYTCYVFQAREDMTISHVGWRTGAVVGSPTADTRIETVGTDGIPTGTLWAANTNLVSGTLSATTWTLHALTTSATILKGDFYAVKILYNSGTSLVTQRSTGYRSNSGNVPYKVTNTSGAAVKSALTNSPSIALGDSSTTFYAVENTIPANTLASSGFNNTNGARRALRFQVPFACRCIGIQFWASSTAGDFNAAMLDDAGNELSSSSTAFEGDRSALNSSCAMPAIFDNGVSLSIGTWYRASIEPTSATNVTPALLTLPSADYRLAMPTSLNVNYATFTTVGGWVDTATNILPMIDILIDQIDNGASGAGGGISRARAAGGW